jgi:hypothetical protein
MSDQYDSKIVDPEELMRQVGQAYNQSVSYQDSGYVQSIHSPGTPDERHSRLAFSTLFRRPNLFRFEWQDRFNQTSPPRTSVIWCDGAGAYKKYGARKQAQTKNLNSAIAGATGVSRGTAHTTSVLLMSDVSGHKLTNHHIYEYVAVEFIADEQCHRLRSRAHHETDLWISTSRSVVLKIFEQYIVGDGPDASTWLKDQAFKSISGFFRWLKLRHLVALSREKEPFHVIEQTHYTNVILDGPIPTEAFSLQGLR